jgi:peptidoglycan/xylan/chitin deacetylase (PgdA/CDA1 family)
MDPAPIISGLSALGVFGAAVALRGILAPRSQLWGPVIWRGDPSLPHRVALTFDDGPHPDSTPRILEVLARKDVKAAFFLIGSQAQRWPGLVRELVEAGHAVGNHSFSHHHFGIFRVGGYWRREIAMAAEVIEDAAGVRPAWFRPPMGFKHRHVLKAARLEGHTVITYTRRALDGVPTTPGRIVERLAPAARPGDILTLHDGVDPHYPHPRTATREALPAVIDGLRARGLFLSRLDELIALPPYASIPKTPRNAAGVAAPSSR